MNKITSDLPSLSISNKTVFYRVDINVPISNGSILDDFRLASIRPTLDFLLSKKASVVIAGHLGRPKGRANKNLSLRKLLPWFTRHGYQPQFAETIDDALKLQAHNAELILLENLRMNPDEEKDSRGWAEQLKTLGEIYVTDAWGAIHRNDVSVALLPTLYQPSNRTVGFLIENEVTSLNRVKYSPSQPFMTVLGGAKVRDKVPLISALLPSLKSIALCPATVFTFLKARGIPVGRSLVDDESIEECRSIEKKAQELGIEILYPVDYVAKNNGTLELNEIIEFAANTVGISIGPSTVGKWTQSVNNAGTIFVNGLAGFVNEPKTYTHYQELLRAIGNSMAYSVIGGGDAVAAALSAGLDDSIDFLSTGGGATLAYLSGQRLPGLKPFE